MIQELKIQNILNNLNSKVKRESKEMAKFDIRDAGKIDVLNFILSFFTMFEENKKLTLSGWAIQLGFMIEGFVSKQAIGEKFYDRHLSHVKSLLTESLSLQLEDLNEKTNLDNQLFKSFKKVFLRDSVCFKLSASLADAFPGSGKGATARIQTVYELKSQVYEYFQLCSYRDNDQKAAADILPFLKKGCLVIQDLGYQCFDVYRQINKKGAFFLTRWSYGTILLNVVSGKRIDLLALLKKEGQIDMLVKLGATDQIEVRIVAKKVSQQVAEKRKRDAKRNQKKGTNHSPRYYKLLEWDIRITNVSKEIWTSDEVLLAYRLRWHIEIIYKAWKSGLNMDKKAIHKMSENKCTMFFYLMLLYAIVNCQVKYCYYRNKINQEYPDKDLSILKFYNFAQEFRKKIEEHKDSEYILKLVNKYCCYEKRKKRKNHEQLFNYQTSTS